MERSTRRREPHRQISPWLEKPERTITSRLASPRSASANTIAGFLPPISSETFLNVLAASAAITAPVRVEPVNDTALIFGCSTIAWPTLGPSPCTMLSTPGGKPHSRASSAKRNAVNGVISEGFATTALPAASAGAIFQVNRYSGRFHG